MSAATVAPVEQRAVSSIVVPHQLTVAGVVRPRSRAQRLLDIAGSTAMLLLLVPVLALIALAVAATSRGGVVYRQTRVGAGGATFTCLKFRTMRADGHQKRSELVHLDEGNGLLFKIRRDPRVTPVGRVLRR